MLVFCLTGWMGMANGVRMQFYRYKNKEYVLAARTMGASDVRIMLRHVLPNAVGTIITQCALSVPKCCIPGSRTFLPGTWCAGAESIDRYAVVRWTESTSGLSVYDCVAGYCYCIFDAGIQSPWERPSGCFQSNAQAIMKDEIRSERTGNEL